MLKSYFYHTKSERIAALGLIVIVIVLFLLQWIWPNQRIQKYDNEVFMKEVESFEMDLARLKESTFAAKNKLYNHNYKKKYKKYNRSKKWSNVTTSTPEESRLNVELFDFNPNDLDKEGFMRLGLSSRTTQSILNYRKKGGKFNVKADLAKIYTLETADFDRLMPYITLPDSLAKKEPQKKQFNKKEYSNPKPKKNYSIELNQATAEDLQKLRGIGPAFSKRIIKYRDALGGFVDIAQVSEVYGLPDSTFRQIQSALRCNGNIQKINLNAASAKELKSHPYLAWKHANAIIRYRKNEGPFTDIEILRTFFEFDDGKGTYWKIKPYLQL